MLISRNWFLRLIFNNVFVVLLISLFSIKIMATENSNPTSWLESEHKKEIQHANDLAIWVDNLWGVKTEPEKEAYTSVRLRFNEFWREGEDL